MKPTRIQLSRKAGWRKPENTVVVSRPSKWGNPFKVGQPGVATNADAAFRFKMFAKEGSDDRWVKMRLSISELRGKNLACWCPVGSPCHADVLLEIANQ